MQSAADPLLSLRRWLGGADIARTIAAQVTVRAASSRTDVAIDHRLTCNLAGHEGWRISTKPTFLPEAHFSSQARHYLRTAGPGRTIYSHERGSQEVIAAVSYHIDARAQMPVLITEIGLRFDSGENAFLINRTLSGALVAKQYVHAIAERIGRGGFVDLDLAERKNEALMRRLGFRPAPRVRDFRPGGRHLRQQPAVSQD